MLRDNAGPLAITHNTGYITLRKQNITQSKLA
jgi:hypothetical protein